MRAIVLSQTIALLLLFLLYDASAQIKKASLLSSQSIKTFSAASSVQLYDDQLYLIGDDQNKILVLDNRFQKVDSIMVDLSNTRQSKLKKMDFESSLITHGAKPELLVFASGSTARRNIMARIPLSETEGSAKVTFDKNYEKFLMELGRRFTHVNLEGATLIDERLIFANRGSYSSKSNSLIIISYDDFSKGKMDGIAVYDLTLTDGEGFKGVSEVFYDSTTGILFLTFSEEMTHDSFNDGEIGNSLLCWINDPREQIQSGNLKIDAKIDLSEVHPSFKGQKIEGVCTGKGENGKHLLYLVSDNDDGMSGIFCLEVSLN